MSGRAPRRGSTLGVLLIVSSFALAGYLWIQYARTGQGREIARLETLAERLEAESVPLKFKILSREGGRIEARVKLYDQLGREVASLEESWPGSSLSVDLLLVPLASDEGGSASWIAFPYRLFTDRVSPARGTTLFDAYAGDGFPRVLDGIEWSDSERATVKAAFDAARRSASRGEPATASSKGAFGSVVHEAATVARLETGVVYKVVCRLRGGVEIMED